MSVLPDDWKTAVVRTTQGGRDPSGNWVDGVEVEVAGCMIAPGTSAEEGQFSDITSSTVRLFAPVEEDAYTPPEQAVWTSGDTVVTPPGSILPGRWQVVGKPVRWPAGWELRLEGEGGRQWHTSPTIGE